MNFSVVIPLYNKALHVERAINSVLQQTIQDFEIIVVNDGSTDDGQEIVEVIQDPRIRLINQSNQGVSVARNRGIEEAKFNLVAFLDADDEWLPEYLRQIQTLINNFPDCGAYATAVKTIRPNGDIYYPILSKLPPEPWIGIIPNFFELFQDALSAFIPSSIVIPKKILLEIGGFPSGVQLLEDISCWVKIAIQYPIAFNPKRMIIYHQDASNRSNIRKNSFEAPYIKTINDAIKDGLLSKGLQGAAQEFIAQSQISTAIECIMNGNPGFAKKLLRSCKNTKIYKNRWLRWWFWASLPTGWPKKLLTMKNSLIR